MKYFLIYLCVINLISVLITIIDKYAAKQGKRRISEKTLLCFSALGGSAAMYITMRIIHHKTRKNKFMVGIPAIFFLQIGLALILYFNFFGNF